MMASDNGVAGDRARERDERFAATRRAPRSPITASRTPVGARRAAAGLLCVTPDRWGGLWHAPAELVLSALFEAAAIARAGSRRGHGGLPAASVVTVHRWLGSFAGAVPADLVEVLERGVDGSFGPEAQLAARDAARSLRTVRSRFDEQLRKTVVCVAGWGLDRLAARPPEISAGSWFAAHWMAAVTPDHDVWSFVTVGPRDGRRRN